MKYSRLIAGTMTWGAWGKQLDTKDIISLINHCLENKITTFDHADIYGGYTTEEDFGKAFTESNVKREDIQLISKCGIQYASDRRPHKVKHYDLSRDYIIWSVEESLRLLKTEYLDLILMHRPSPLMHPDEIAEAISHLTKQGKIKKFGVSNFTPSQMEMISNKVPISANQIEFSLTAHSAMHDGTLDTMITKDILPMAWSPLGNVFREDTEQTRRIHKQLGALMEKYNATEDQLLLAWLMKHPAHIHPVIGTTTPKRISDAVVASKIKMELEDWFLILVASQGHKVP